MTESDKPRFAAAMLAMYKAFRVEPDKDISRIHFQTLVHLTIEDAEFCVSKAMMEEDKFPTPHAVKRYQSMIPAKPVQRIEYKHTPERTDLTAKATKLIDGILDGRLTRRQLVEGMTHMESLFPDIGWKSEASQLAMFYSSLERQP